MSDMARNAYSGTASAIALGMVPEVDANRTSRSMSACATKAIRQWRSACRRVSQSLKLRNSARASVQRDNRRRRCGVSVVGEAEVGRALTGAGDPQ